MRRTRIGMIAIGLVVWVVAVAWPGMQVSLLVLSGALVAWATFGLLTAGIACAVLEDGIARTSGTITPTVAASDSVNRDVVLRYVDAWNSDDAEALAETLAPDVRVTRPRGTTVGRDEFIAAVRAQRETPTADELDVTIHDRTIEEVGDKVITTIRLDYHWRESGEFSHSMRRRSEFTVRDGKIVEMVAGAPERIDS